MKRMDKKKFAKFLESISDQSIGTFCACPWMLKMKVHSNKENNALGLIADGDKDSQVLLERFLVQSLAGSSDIYLLNSHMLRRLVRGDFSLIKEDYEEDEDGEQ